MRLRIARPRPGSTRSALLGWASLRWAALPIRDRRWTAPLAACAIGMGVFIGVALGPNVEGTLGTGAESAALTQVSPPLTAPKTAPADTGDQADRQGGGGADDLGDGGTDGTPSLDSSIPLSPSTTIPSVPSTSSAPYTPPTTTPTTTPTDESTTTEPEPLVLSGTVVHLNPVARSYTLAGEDGQLQAVHTHDLPVPGTSVETEVRQLANGTYAEDAQRVEGGRRARAELRGLVTWRDSRSGDYTVSGAGSSILIDARVRAAGPAAPPPVGARVVLDAKISDAALSVGEATVIDANVNIDPPPVGGITGGRTPNTSGRTPPPLPAPRVQALPDGCGAGPKPPPAPLSTLTESALEVETEFVGAVQIAGIVQGVCRGSRELVLSADDVDRSGGDVVLRVPKPLRLSPLRAGQALDVSVSIDPDDGALEATALASDEGAKAADDPKLSQPAG